MEAKDFSKMDNPAVAFYLFALATALSTFACGVYPTYVPDEVKYNIEHIALYFYRQLPDDGFKVMKPENYRKGPGGV